MGSFHMTDLKPGFEISHVTGCVTSGTAKNDCAVVR